MFYVVLIIGVASVSPVVSGGPHHVEAWHSWQRKILQETSWTEKWLTQFSTFVCLLLWLLLFLLLWLLLLLSYYFL